MWYTCVGIKMASLNRAGLGTKEPANSVANPAKSRIAYVISLFDATMALKVRLIKQ